MIAGVGAGVLAVEVDTSVLRSALLIGALGAGLAALAALFWRNKRPGVVGLPIAIGALVTIRYELGPASAPILIFGAAAVAFVAGEIGARFEHPVFIFTPVLGGVVFALTPIPTVPVIARVLAALGAVVTGIATADFDRRHASQGLGVMFVVITCFAPMFLTPGSGVGPAMAGAAAWMVLLLLPRPFARVGAGGACAFAIAYWWAVLISAGWVGTGGGDNVVAGAVACGFLLVEPLARAVLENLSGVKSRQRSTKDSVWLVIAVAVAAQGAFVAYAAGVTARFDQLDSALLSALPVLLVGAVVSTEVVPSPRRQARKQVDA